eukprot:TRINITY_DN1311_c0_g1_i1.p1 TRINITY_DN1311_c0_g1~~TRINITY_DN1311_c0_g1_i1.p1  ORF type:complete len:576 (-),score=160.44 TRINITY_DN1311_c0_g1_i1:93-1793(-)
MSVFFRKFQRVLAKIGSSQDTFAPESFVLRNSFEKLRADKDLFNKNWDTRIVYLTDKYLLWFEDENQPAHREYAVKDINRVFHEKIGSDISVLSIVIGEKKYYFRSDIDVINRWVLRMNEVIDNRDSNLPIFLFNKNIDYTRVIDESIKTLWFLTEATKRILDNTSLIEPLANTIQFAETNGIDIPVFPENSALCEYQNDFDVEFESIFSKYKYSKEWPFQTDPIDLSDFVFSKDEDGIKFLYRFSSIDTAIENLLNDYLFVTVQTQQIVDSGLHLTSEKERKIIAKTKLLIQQCCWKFIFILGIHSFYLTLINGPETEYQSIEELALNLVQLPGFEHQEAALVAMSDTSNTLIRYHSTYCATAYWNSSNFEIDVGDVKYFFEHLELEQMVALGIKRIQDGQLIKGFLTSGFQNNCLLNLFVGGLEGECNQVDVGYLFFTDFGAYSIEESIGLVNFGKHSITGLGDFGDELMNFVENLNHLKADLPVMLAAAIGLIEQGFAMHPELQFDFFPDLSLAEFIVQIFSTPIEAQNEIKNDQIEQENFFVKEEEILENNLSLEEIIEKEL